MKKIIAGGFVFLGGCMIFSGCIIYDAIPGNTPSMIEGEILFSLVLMLGGGGLMAYDQLKVLYDRHKSNK